MTEAYHLPISEPEARALLRLLASSGATQLHDRVARLIEPGARRPSSEAAEIESYMDWDSRISDCPDSNGTAGCLTWAGAGESGVWLLDVWFPGQDVRDHLRPVIVRAVAEYIAANPSFGASFA
jgi:hypothetical protein